MSLQATTTSDLTTVFSIIWICICLFHTRNIHHNTSHVCIYKYVFVCAYTLYTPFSVILKHKYFRYWPEIFLKRKCAPFLGPVLLGTFVPISVKLLSVLHWRLMLIASPFHWILNSPGKSYEHSVGDPGSWHAGGMRYVCINVCVRKQEPLAFLCIFHNGFDLLQSRVYPPVVTYVWDSVVCLNCPHKWGKVRKIPNSLSLTHTEHCTTPYDRCWWSNSSGKKVPLCSNHSRWGRGIEDGLR